MKTPIALLFSLVVLIACTENKEKTLAQKKNQLASYAKELEDLKQKMANLEKEIALIDTIKGSLKPRTVTLGIVQTQNFPHYIESQATIEANQNVMLGFPMGGPVTAVLVSEGSEVKAGQVLAETDSRTLRESLAQLESGYQLAKTTFERQQRLWDQKIGSELQYLQAKTQFESMERNKASLQAQLDMTRIKAPFSGMVDMVAIKTGEVAPPGIGLIRIVNMDQIKVVARLADSYMKMVNKNTPALVIIKDTGDTIPANLNFVSKVVNPMSRTFTVEAQLSSKPAYLRPNMLVELLLNDRVYEKAIAVPANFVLKDANNQDYIMTARELSKDNWVAQKTMVKKGIIFREKVLIEQGLESGVRYIVAGFQDVVDGQKLIVKP